MYLEYFLYGKPNQNCVFAYRSPLKNINLNSEILTHIFFFNSKYCGTIQFVVGLTHNCRTAYMEEPWI